MNKLSRKGIAAVAFLATLFTMGLVWMSLRAWSAASPPVTLQEAFPQPPGGPPPGRPPVLASVPASVAPLPASPAVSSAVSPPAAAPGAASSASGGTSATPPANGVHPAPPVLTETAEIVVHVAGAVHKPGVYHLPVGARNDEAIKQAGGPTSEANTDGINLAARVEDGSQLYLPTRKQHPEGGADAPTDASQSAPAVKTALAGAKSAAKPGAHAGAKPAGAKGGKSGKLSNPAQGTVNINTAGAEELQRIPGIGPAMADRILEFRQQSGKFTAPEDLLQISGIGEKKFAKMQPFIRVK